MPFSSRRLFGTRLADARYGDSDHPKSLQHRLAVVDDLAPSIRMDKTAI